MSGLLEGNELEKDIGNIGKVIVDVTKEGKVNIDVSVKVAEGELASAGVSVTASADLFAILESVAVKNEVAWGPAAIAQIKTILGLVG